MKKCLYIILMCFTACAPEITGGRLSFNEADPGKGFNYPYYLFIPDDADLHKELVLIVEPNNSGFVSDDPEKHREKAERTSSREFYTGNYAARRLGYPLLVPVFPRPETQWEIYTHAYDRDLALQKGTPLERIDLQLLSMVEDARRKLSEKGFKLKEQFLMTGFSASGTFVNRFTAIHPNKVLAAAAGGVNGLLILPAEEIGNNRLNFPLGINDFSALFNKNFDSVAFKNTPQFLYMGEFDENDAIPYADGYDDEERKIIYSTLDSIMLPNRWGKCREIYKRKDIDARILTFQGIGHEHTESVKDEIVEFFKKQLGNELIVE